MTLDSSTLKKTFPEGEQKAKSTTGRSHYMPMSKEDERSQAPNPDWKIFAQIDETATCKHWEEE